MATEPLFSTLRVTIFTLLAFQPRQTNSLSKPSTAVCATVAQPTSSFKPNPKPFHCQSSGNRRDFLNCGIIGGAISTAVLAPPAEAVADDAEREQGAVVAASSTPATLTFIRGAVTVSSNAANEFEKYEAPASALYITCRPDRPDNVPAAILNGSRGKPPPILSARFPNPTFPFTFELTSDNITVEGAAAANNDGVLQYWWAKDDLIVSARWDGDGVAATRSPEDLVGRGFAKSGRTSRADNSVMVELQGRGAFGKFATGAKK